MTLIAMNTKRDGMIRIWLLNFFANAALLAAAYFWLLIPDAHGWQVIGSILLLAGMVFLLVWLRAGTLAYFRLAEFRDHATLWPAYRRGLRYLLPLALWAALFALLAWLLWCLRTYTPQAGVWIRQKLEAGPPPRNLTRDINWLIVLIVSVIMPALWLPVATTISAIGPRPARMRRSLHVLRHPSYWVWLCALIALGVYLPYRLVWWVPELEGLRKQAWSMALRFFGAYFIWVTAFIALVWKVAVRTECEDAEITKADLPRTDLR